MVMGTMMDVKAESVVTAGGSMGIEALSGEDYIRGSGGRWQYARGSGGRWWCGAVRWEGSDIVMVGREGGIK